MVIVDKKDGSKIIFCVDFWKLNQFTKPIFYTLHDMHEDCRSHICICGYYPCFIPNFTEITKPFIAFTRKYAKFEWSEKCHKTFNFL